MENKNPILINGDGVLLEDVQTFLRANPNSDLMIFIGLGEFGEQTIKCSIEDCLDLHMFAEHVETQFRKISGLESFKCFYTGTNILMYNTVSNPIKSFNVNVDLDKVLKITADTGAKLI